jgi:hypothetical protein
MREYPRRLFTALALTAAAVLIWYVGHRLLDLSDALMDRVGPIWALIIYGVLTVALGAVWIRYGGAGALGRWGVTIKPAASHDASHDPAHGSGESADADLPGTHH